MSTKNVHSLSNAQNVTALSNQEPCNCTATENFTFLKASSDGKYFTFDESFENDSIQFGAFLFWVMDSKEMPVIKYLLDLMGG